MVKLISYDGITVIFPKNLAEEIPYIVDAFDNPAMLDTDTELHAPFASGAQLSILRRIVSAKVTLNSASFIPLFGNIQLGDDCLPSPPFHSLIWKSCLTEVFMNLTQQETVDLLTVADAMCMWELRTGVMYLIIYNILKYKMTIRSFNVRLQGIIKDLYISTVVHNDCCAHLDSMIHM